MTAPQPEHNPYPVGEDGPVYLTTRELAERFRTAVSSVHEWRQRGTGPLGIKFGRCVLYPLPEVEAWERKQVETAKREQRRRGAGITSI